MVRIRRYVDGEAPALFEIYFSAIHLVASRYYTPEQIQAWAPADLDPGIWAAKMREIQPHVAVLDGNPVGYADVQQSGYIDHFFVSGRHPRQGIGSQLMTHLIAEADAMGIGELTSHVSRAAQPFYQAFGFEIVEERQPVVRGVMVPNALMRRRVAGTQLPMIEEP